MDKTKPVQPAPTPILVLAFYTVVLVWVATRPGGELAWAEMYWDKARHFGAFFMLTGMALWNLGFPNFSCKQFAARGGWAVLYALGIGALIELLQTRIPGRTADVMDLAADLVGAVLAVLAVWMILRRKERLERNPYGAHQRTF